jgi:hypothetical protein
MTRNQSTALAEAVSRMLTDTSDEAESLDLQHLEIREKAGEPGLWQIQSDWHDLEEDEIVHRTFVMTVDSDGIIADNYESN